MNAATLDSACIFCRIIRGEIPAQRLFENKRVLAFLDVSPLSCGHFLVIPKFHAERLHDLPGEFATALVALLAPLAARAEDDFGIARLAYQVETAGESGEGVRWRKPQSAR